MEAPTLSVPCAKSKRWIEKPRPLDPKADGPKGRASSVDRKPATIVAASGEAWAEDPEAPLERIASSSSGATAPGRKDRGGRRARTISGGLASTADAVPAPAQPSIRRASSRRSSAAASPQLSPNLSPQGSGGEDLVDLVPRLKEMGIYAEYLEYRKNYLAWRQGAHRGAVGEVTHEALQQGRDQCEASAVFIADLPTPTMFKWRFLAAYWTAIAFLLGSLLFMFNGVIDAFHGPGGRVTRTWPNAFGGLSYVIGCYAMYFQMINVAGDQKVYFFSPDWAAVKMKLDRSSFVGIVSYFVGAIIFTIGVATPVMPGAEDMSKLGQVMLVDVPNIAGSIGFVSGGISELCHNQVFRSGGSDWSQPVWWSSLLNFIGSCLFLLGSLSPFMCVSAFWCNVIFLLGSTAFAVSSCALIMMWRSNDFGMTLLRQLNLASMTGVTLTRTSTGRGVQVQFGQPMSAQDTEQQQGFSIRGMFFILVYCWLAFASILNCICDPVWIATKQQGELSGDMFRTFAILRQGLIVMIVLLVLLVQAAVPRLPKEQPFRGVLIVARVVLLFFAIDETILGAVMLQSMPVLGDSTLASPRSYWSRQASVALGVVLKS